MPTRQHYQRIADRFETAVRESLATLDRVADISETIAVSQRTLSRAVRIVHGTTPVRFAQSLRLAEARKALLSARAASETVTAVAMRFGFHELGRFAADYRAAFGESPSDTMRRGCSAASHCR